MKGNGKDAARSIFTEIRFDGIV